MTLGWQLHERECWPTRQESIDAHFAAHVPQLIAVSGKAIGLKYLKISGTWYQVYDNAGVLTATMVSTPSPTNTCDLEAFQAANQQNIQVTVNTSGTGGTTGNDPVFDPAVGGSFFAVAFIGVLGTWILSQNIGLILEAIKKW